MGNGPSMTLQERWQQQSLACRCAKAKAFSGFLVPPAEGPLTQGPLDALVGSRDWVSGFQRDFNRVCKKEHSDGQHMIRLTAKHRLTPIFDFKVPEVNKTL